MPKYFVAAADAADAAVLLLVLSMLLEFVLLAMIMAKYFIAIPGIRHYF